MLLYENYLLGKSRCCIHFKLQFSRQLLLLAVTQIPQIGSTDSVLQIEPYHCRCRALKVVTHHCKVYALNHQEVADFSNQLVHLQQRRCSMNHWFQLPLHPIITVCSWKFLSSGTALLVSESGDVTSLQTPSSLQKQGAFLSLTFTNCFRQATQDKCDFGVLPFCAQANYLLSQIPIGCIQCHSEVQQHMDIQIDFTFS